MKKSSFGVCVVGLGRHGRGALLAAQHLQQQEQAFQLSCYDPDPKVMSGDWKNLLAPNLGIPIPEQFEFTGVRRFEPEQAEAVAADPDVHLAWLCVPTHLHPGLAEKLLRAGKHVFCEKPIALDSGTGQHLVQVAAEAGKCLLIAQELPFFLDFAFLQDLIQGGSHGKLRELRLTRFISDSDETVGVDKAAQFGGPGLDLHVHDTNFVRTNVGMPVSVRTIGHGFGAYLETGLTEYSFGDDGPKVISQFGALPESGLLFRHGFSALFEDGTGYQYELSVTQVGGEVQVMPTVPLTRITYQGTDPQKVELLSVGNDNVPDGMGPLVRELEHGLAVINDDADPLSLDPQGAVDAISMCEVEAVSRTSNVAVDL